VAAPTIEHLTYALCSNPSAKLATSSRLSVAAASPACAGCLLPSTSVPWVLQSSLGWSSGLRRTPAPWLNCRATRNLVACWFFGLAVWIAQLAPPDPSHRLVVNFRLQPDLASSAKPPMSIRHPPSIAPPDHQWLTSWLSPSVSSSGSASFSGAPTFVGSPSSGLALRSVSLAFARVLISVTWLAACLRLSPAACCHSSGNHPATRYW